MKVPMCLMPYLNAFQASAKRHKLDVGLLLALCMHESNGGLSLTPPGPAGVGDNGHAVGIMQIDRRFHGPFVAQLDADGTPTWQRAGANIEYAAMLLRQCLDAFPGEEGLGVIAYNRGPGNVRKALAGLPPGATPAQRFAEADKGSANGNYGRSVLATRIEFHT